MTLKSKRVFWLPLASLLSLSGCALEQRLAEHEAETRKAQTSVAQTKQAFEKRVGNRAERLKAQSVDRPWVMSRAVPLAREVSLPAALRTKLNTTLLFREGKSNLVVLSERITQATGIPVRIKPEALLPAENFLPRLSVATAALTVPMPQQVLLPYGPQPLPKILDQISQRLAVSWRYHEQAIEFFRTQTRVFDIRTLTLSAETDVRLGRSGQSKAGGFENTSRTSLKTTEQHVLEAIKQRIEPFLTLGGMVAAQPGALSSIVVTDTPDNLNEIARFIERENRALTRRVRLIFEELTLQTHQEADLSLDWEVLLEHGSQALALSSAASGATIGAAGAALGGSHRALQPSTLLLNALAKFGTVLRHVTIPVVTMNKRPVTHALRTTFSYIDQIKSGAGPVVASSTGLNSGPSVSISQKEETVGSFLTLVPDAQENGQILLSVSYDNTVAQPIKTVTVGEPSSRMQIQQITIDGNGTVQQVALKPGQPMLISGFDQTQAALDRVRLTEEAPILLGGADRNKKTRVVTLLVVTAQVEEGG